MSPDFFRSTRRVALAPAALACVLAAVACQKTRDIERVDPSDQTEFQAKFNEVDAREISAALITDCLARPWLPSWEATHQKNPVIIVGDLANNTSDYIDTNLVTKAFERDLLNSGRVAIVASSRERPQIRDERRDQQDWSRPETVKRMAYELGADMILIGWIGEVRQDSRDSRRQSRYFEISLELIDVESNQKLWIGTHAIKKLVRYRN